VQKIKRTPEIEQELAKDIMDHPTEYGVEKIRSAISYLTDSFEDRRGMIQFQEEMFREGEDELYSVVLRNHYATGNIMNLTLDFEGLEPTSDLSLERENVRGLSDRMRKFHNPMIILNPRIQLSLDDGIFEDCEMRFGNAINNHSAKRDVGLGEHVAPGEGYNGRLVLAHKPWSEPHMTMELTKNSGSTFNFQPEYESTETGLSRQLTYLCDAKRIDSQLVLKNLGPDRIPLVFSKPRGLET